MLIVISNPTPVNDETTIINALFDEGLEVLHVRKPRASVNELRVLIQKIHSKYHHQLALHQHHKVAVDFGINRLHFTEVKRHAMKEEVLMKLKDNHTILSTSIHQIESHKTLSASFDYTFFGPVFNSISKQGYNSILSEDFVLPSELNHPKTIAIGGIYASNIQQVKRMQFNGAAVLGTIWQQLNESIQQFKTIQKLWY